MIEPVLSVADLEVTLKRGRERHRVLDRVSFVVAIGEIMAVVGESGAGKSTLGAAIQGLLPKDGDPEVSGSIRLAGQQIVGSPPGFLRSARRTLVRSVPQDPMGALNPTMTIRRQLEESADGSATQIIDALCRAGLPDGKRIAGAFPHQLSGGERQRVLLAMAMIARPKLLIADEPTTALDVTTQAKLLKIVRTLARDQQCGILYITHDLNVAAAVADRVMVLQGGRVVELGTLRQIATAPRHAHTAKLFAARLDLNSDRSCPSPAQAQASRGDEKGEEDGKEDRRACGEVGRQAAPSITAPGTLSGRHGSMALELSNVFKSFGAERKCTWRRALAMPVLRGVNLSIPAGQSVAVVGESGAGKSTLLRIAAGLLAADSGHVSRVDALPQVVFQDPVAALTPWLSIGQQIEERLRPGFGGAAERSIGIRNALQQVGLDPSLTNAMPSELSVGQCQRAVVARAIVNPPRLILCDEPVSAMDAPLAVTILNLLNNLRRRLGLAMLFVTHDLAAARMVADRIAVLHEGAMIEEFDADGLLDPSRSAVTRALIEASPSLYKVLP
ncbi:ABC transporter ATP-binding protein [Ensifer sp. ENS12]|uniref:ATP-binding cassette domain-containing protein n=1 Tax=Ensifer sp. ENS12 TaxID=2854774 RepID=UPI000DE57ABA|nr:ABC transporter ATP-binding protein [Ensifer sp. ENS12]MBV7518852.1 ABC transporter ATP-binding protein [Ensifer sp. ENS12]